MRSGLPWSEAFVRDLSEKEFRDEFVADQVRTRIALLIRALREQPDRNWSQTRLAQEMGKPQSVVSRLEDPDYGKMSLQTLLEVASAYDLPLWIDFPEWDEWGRMIRNVPNSGTVRRGFDAARLIPSDENETKASSDRSKVVRLADWLKADAEQNNKLLSVSGTTPSIDVKMMEA